MSDINKNYNINTNSNDVLTGLHYLLVSLVCLYVGKNIYKVHGRTKCNTCFNPGVQRKSEQMYIGKYVNQNPVIACCCCVAACWYLPTPFPSRRFFSRKNA